MLYKRKRKYLDGLENQSTITDDSRSHFKIYNNARYGRITRTTIDRWIERTITNKGLERFVNKGLVKIIYGKKYDKIYLYLPEKLFLNTDNSNDEAEELFWVQDSNPMIDYYLYSKEMKVKECVVCGKKFTVIGGNVKTCCTKCSRINELRNKNL